jgi:tetratricopeptide (TPR) repeat protein
MRGLQIEYVCKGIFLGLLFFVALQAHSWSDAETVTLCLLAGLGASLAIAGFDKVRAGYRLQGRLAAFFFFLLLESPTLVYAGILLGLAAAAKLIGKEDQGQLLVFSVAGGAAVGFVFWLVRHLPNKWARFGVILALAAGIPAAGIYWLHVDESLVPDRTMFGYMLLIGIPFFYMLTFAGRAEESEVEIGAMCAALGAGMYLINLTPSLRSIPFIFPLAIFYVYTVRFLPRLRVFKYALRGHSYANIGKHRQALQAFRRALALDPKYKLAREGLWTVHRAMDLTQVERDPEMLALVDVNVCLERVAGVLLAGKPPAAKMQEVQHLLQLVERQQPNKRPVALYWRCVADLHEQKYEQAAAALKAVIDPAGYEPRDPERRSVLFQAWQLAVMLHPEMQKRVGGPQLAEPGRRMEAIAAVERHLEASPEDPGAWDLKRILYSNLTEADYAAAVGEGKAAAAFDHGYAQQLGLALINDRDRWPRGSEYLRIAARGMPATGPSIYTQIAQANQRGGNMDAALQHYLLAQRVGRSVGPQNLSAEEQAAYFAAVKFLADSAVTRGDLDTAIENYHLYTENERSGLETLRTLAGLYEKKQDQRSIGNAIRVVEIALVYDGKDKDLLDRKDRYYYSLEPAELQARLETLGKAIDVDYCITKAKTILDGKYSDDTEQQMLHWGLHLAELARVVRPESVQVRWLCARARLRRGERDEAVAILEGIRNKPPEKMSGDDADAWYEVNRRLGYLYLDELSRPDLAIPCFTEFRKSSKSGADSLYRLGQAHEAIGDLAKAKRFYEQVTAYEQHPLAPEAREALYRLQSSGVS